MWDRTEAVLRDVLSSLAVSYVEARDEAAFYGPKIDVQVVDAAGREMTLSTVQLDFHQPERFDLSYVDSGGGRRRPIMVHRSIVGSMERLFAYLIEVHQGAFPMWYAPVQVEVLPVGDVAVDGFFRAAVAAGLRAQVASEGTLAARVRDAARRRVPYAAVIGAREAAEGRVALRLRDGRALDPLPEPEALNLMVAAARPA